MVFLHPYSKQRTNNYLGTLGIEVYEYYLTWVGGEHYVAFGPRKAWQSLRTHFSSRTLAPISNVYAGRESRVRAAPSVGCRKLTP